MEKVEKNVCKPPDQTYEHMSKSELDSQITINGIKNS